MTLCLLYLETVLLPKNYFSLKHDVHTYVDKGPFNYYVRVFGGSKQTSRILSLSYMSSLTEQNKFLPFPNLDLNVKNLTYIGQVFSL